MNVDPHFRISNKVIDDNILSIFTGDELKVYLVLFRRSNSGKDHCFCKYSTISLNTGIEIKHIASIISNLEQKGAIRVGSKNQLSKGLEYQVFDWSVLTASNKNPAIAISAPSNSTSSSCYEELLEYCTSNNNLRRYSFQIKSGSPISEFKFRLNKDLSDSQKEQIYKAILEAIKTKNIDAVDPILEDFTSNDIDLIKSSYNISVALNMGDNEIDRRNQSLSIDGYMQWLLNK